MKISKKLDSLRICFCVVVKLSNVHEKYTKRETCYLTSNENHKPSFIKYTATLIPFNENEPRPQQFPPHLFRFENNSFIGNIHRVYVSRVLLLIVVMLATKPRNSQRPTICSYLLGRPPSLAKLRKATEYSSLFLPNK